MHQKFFDNEYTDNDEQVIDEIEAIKIQAQSQQIGTLKQSSSTRLKKPSATELE